MASTKVVESTIQGIESRLKSFGGDMVKIEFLENCLKQAVLANDVKRFCYLKLADFYAYKLMWLFAARNMEGAAECATTYKDKIKFYMEEINYLIKINDFLMIDKAFKKALLCGVNSNDKDQIKHQLKIALLSQAENYEKRNQRSNAARIYERLLDIPITNETEKKHIIEKLGALNSRLGKIKEAVRYEMMSKRPIEVKKDPESDVRRVSFEDLGLDEVR